MRNALGRIGAALLVTCALAPLSGPAAEPSPSPTTHARARPTERPSLAAALRKDLEAYLAARSAPEHISVLSVSVSRGSQVGLVTATASVAAFGQSVTMTPASLFQIGSNTKSFTAAAILQLEAERKVTLEQTVGKWLPQYPLWKSITIRRLLDMTSGIPTYDDTAAWMRDMSQDPYRYISPRALIAYVSGSRSLHTGYYYSNTAYILSQLIIEKASGHSYAYELQSRFFKPLGLANTYYSSDVYPQAIRARTVPGYFANTSAENAGLRPLLGRDVRNFSVSWAQGAGAIVSTPSDLVRWVRALYRGSVLAQRQRQELLSIVSTKSGKPIAITSPDDPRGFGLGVVQMTKDPLGRFWFYEGETLGYRVVYAYLPKKDLVFAVGANSAPTGSEDQVGQLMVAVYKTIESYR